MNSRGRVRVFALASLLATGPAATLQSQSSPQGKKVEGWTIVQKSTTDSGLGRPPAVRSIRLVGSGSRLRIESSSRSGATSATISDTLTHEHLVITPERKTVMSGRLPRIESLIHIEPLSLDRKVRDLGPAEMIAGLATHRYEVTAKVGSRISNGSRTCVLQRPGTVMYWMTTNPRAMTAIHAQTRLMMATIGSGGAVRPLPDSDPPGVVVRSISSHAVIGADGKRHEITTTNELAEFRSGPVEEALFEVPTGYLRQNENTPQLSAMMEKVNREAMAHAFSKMVDSAPMIVGETRTCTTVKNP